MLFLIHDSKLHIFRTKVEIKRTHYLSDLEKSYKIEQIEDVHTLPLLEQLFKKLNNLHRFHILFKRSSNTIIYEMC